MAIEGYPEITDFSKLNPKSKDYASQVENGIRQIFDARRILNQRSERALIDCLEGVKYDVNQKFPAFKVTTFGPITEPVYEEEEFKGLGLKSRTIIEGSGTVEDRRQVEDIVRTHELIIRRTLEEIIGEKVKLQRHMEDYALPFVFLTETTPLGKEDLDKNDAHFFVVRKNGVYIAHFNPEGSGLIGPTPLPDLEPSSFYDKKYLKKFEKEVNAYRVTHPSDKDLPNFTNIMVYTGLIRFLENRIEYNARTADASVKAHRKDPQEYAKEVLKMMKEI